MLRQLKYFQSVVRLNSFLEAAEENFISQSAISQQIQALERELGFVLSERIQFMIFYFTGTGNSLYIAKQIESNPISIPQIIHEEKQEYFADSIGIVAPVYGHEVPQMVRDFMKKTAFHTDYFYMILTYGNRHGGAAELAEKLCEECGIPVNYINVIMMADNWLPSFDMNDQKKIDKHIPEQLAPTPGSI